MIPDADIVLLLKKTNDTPKINYCFGWATRANVKKVYSIKNRPLLIVDDDVLAVRDFRPEKTSCQSPDGSVTLLYGDDDSPQIVTGLCAECKTNDYATFVKVGDECGKYKKGSHMTAPPFFARFKYAETSNELLVVDLWYKMQLSYMALNFNLPQF